MSEAAAPRRKTAAPALPSLLSDERLARRAAAGDERAFATIYRRYHQRLYRYCLALLGSREEAEDALQNTMVKALRALPGEERRIDLKPWLYRVAHNESVDLLRRRRGEERLDPEMRAGGEEPGEQAATRERLRWLIADLGQLPERQRGALLMRELSGLDFAEIGAALGTSAATARQTLYEARLSLRQMDEGREMSCEAVTKALSEGDGRITRRRDIRAHLRHCHGCRRFREEIAGRQRDLGALAPLPAVAAAGILQGLLGGIGGGGGGAVAAAGAGAGLGGSAALKATATVAVVAALGTAGADRGGLIDAGLPGGGEDGAPSRVQGAAGTGPAEAGTEAAQPSGEAARDEGGRRPALTEGRAAKSSPAATALGERDEKPGAQPAASGPGAGPAPPAGDGPDRDETLPAASSHGQQTAAAHKAPGNGSPGKGSKGRGGSQPGQAGQPEHPTKPAHAAQPPKPEHPQPPSQAGGPATPAPAGADPQPPAASPEGSGAKGEARAAESAAP